MFSLSVRSLDGTRRQMDVTPETTLADIQARLEEQRPAFHEVRLLELHVLTVESPTKALAELERLASEADSIIEESGDLVEDVSEQQQGMITVNKELNKMQELCPNDAARLWEFLDRNYSSDVFQYCLADCDELAMTLAATFGRKCGDPSPHVATLVGWLEYRDCIRSPLAAIAGIQIAERLDDAMPGSLREALTRWASSVAGAFGNTTFHELDCACRLLGLFGDDACMNSLQVVINHACPHEHKAAAAQAVELIGARILKKAL